ncbi:hypothetical protein KFK09_015922 [Dendrobium nobile]|uniref:B3 domain-containing protein n=1 Tax=Dendrobium nobile TaxID=94219 RepID=A0A8T3B7M7_DENNO|nr:hypothetical protein KFK09_015922 [Dendrobium nobile]
MESDGEGSLCLRHQRPTKPLLDKKENHRRPNKDERRACIRESDFYCCIEQAPTLLQRRRRRSRGRKQGREHGGLEVMVYNKNGWGCSLYLTRWEESKASLFKGGKHRELHRRIHFAVGDQVEIWVFRIGDGKLCFVIANKVDLVISL